MPDQNAQIAYDYLRAVGLSDGAAVGVVGNLIAESGLSTTVKGDGGRATGIAQWHSPRWDQLVSWARGQGKSPYALDAQLGFAVAEAQTSAGGNVWTQLKTINDPVTASALWMRRFERPADQSDAAAQRRAAAGASALKGKSGTDWTSWLKALVPGIAIGEKVIPPTVDAAGEAARSVSDAVAGGVQAAAGTLVDGAKPLIVKSAFALLAVGLIGAGVIRATGVRERVQSAAGALL